MTTQTTEAFEALIANTCMGILHIAQTEPSLTALQRNNIAFTIDLIKKSSKDMKKKMSYLNIIQQSVYDICKSNSYVLQTED